MHTLLDERDKVEIESQIQKISNNSIVSKKAGNSIVAYDSAGNKPKGLRVLGKTEQKTYSGKNLLPNNAATTESKGITFAVNADGSISLNGTSTGKTSIRIYEGEFSDGLLLSGSPSDGNDGDTYRLQIVNLTDGSYTILARDSGSGSPINISKFNSGYVEIVIEKDITVSNVTFYPMIRLASITDSTYEPYVGGIPSPNPSYPQELVSVGGDGNVEVGVYGENLIPYPYTFNTSTRGGLTYTANEDGSITVTGTKTGTSFFNLIGGIINDYSTEKIVFSETIYTLIENGYRLSARLTDGTYINGITTDNIKNKPIGALYVESTYANNTVINDVIHPLISYANIKEWKPYNKLSLTISTPNGLQGIPVTDASLATYTDENGQMWCSDEVDFERGVYIQRVDVEVLTTLSMHEETSDYPGRFVRFLTLKNSYLNGKNPVVSNKFYFGGWGLATNDKWVISLSNSMLYIAPPKGSGYTVDALNVCLAENISADNPLIIAAILETPIETPLSEEELAQYKALHTNYPNTTILNDSNAHMEVKYTADIKNHIEQNYVSKEAAETLLSRVSNIEKNMV